MAEPIYIMQNSFAGGEYSPTMDARQDIEKYGSGAGKLLNLFVLPHGAVRRRPGFRYIADCIDHNRKSRLISFQFNIEQAYIIEFGHLYCKFYRNDTDLGIRVPSPYTSDEIGDLKFTQSADVLYIVHPKKQQYKLMRLTSTDFKFELFEFRNGPFLPLAAKPSAIKPSGTTETITLISNQPIPGKCLLKIEQDIEARSITESIWAFGNTRTIDEIIDNNFVSEQISGDGNIIWTISITGEWEGKIELQTKSAVLFPFVQPEWSAYRTYYENKTDTGTISGDTRRLFRIVGNIISGSAHVTLNINHTSSITTAIRGKGQWSLTTHGTWNGTIALQKSKDGVTWDKLKQYSSEEDYNPIDSGNEDEWCYIRVIATSWTKGGVKIDLQWLPFTNYGIVKVTSESGTTVTAEVLEELGSTNETDAWYEGSWSDYRGWPAAVNFFQNRLFMGNTSWQPQTLWGSKSGDYTNYGISSPMVDDDAITVPLVSNQVNAIHSLKALTSLLGFTEGGHWTISGGNDAGTLTPTSINATPEGYFGANKIDPLIIGNRIVYVQSKGSIVRDVGYDFSSDSYIGSHLTLLAEHLFRNRKIVDWIYQQEPNSIIWCVTDDGLLLGLTYIKEQNIYAWHRHETDGFFESICSIPGEKEDQIWVIVRRMINGQIRRYIEKMETYRPTTDPADQFYVDSGLSYEGEPASLFSGLDHLEGKTVQILADGNVYDEQIVKNGTIELPTIPEKPIKVHIGLKYTSELETLNIDFPARDGTIQSRRKRIIGVTLRLENTRNVWIGNTFDKMNELKIRQYENWDMPINLFSGDKYMALSGGSDTKGRICIRMDEPLPMTILAIIHMVVLD